MAAQNGGSAKRSMLCVVARCEKIFSEPCQRIAPAFCQDLARAEKSSVRVLAIRHAAWDEQVGPICFGPRWSAEWSSSTNAIFSCMTARGRRTSRADASGRAPCPSQESHPAHTPRLVPQETVTMTQGRFRPLERWRGHELIGNSHPTGKPVTAIEPRCPRWNSISPASCMSRGP